MTSASTSRHRPAALPQSSVADLRAIELTPQHEPALQRLFEVNPGYFIAANGEAPGPDTAKQELEFALPEGWAFTRKWLIGYANNGGGLAAVASVISDFIAPRVWHIGLLLLEDARHGSGQARTLYDELESWAASNGAAWMRLGVVKGNARAERFWESLGYTETRTRDNQHMGLKMNSVRVMVKPLAGGDLDRYLALMPRDRPE